MNVRTSSIATTDQVIDLFSGLSDPEIKVTRIGDKELDVVGITEPDIRLLIQIKLDRVKFSFPSQYVMVGGITVWSHNSIISQIDEFYSTGKMSNYLFWFMKANCDMTIDEFLVIKSGTIQKTDSYMNIIGGILCAESTVKPWKTDVHRIIKTIKKRYTCTA